MIQVSHISKIYNATSYKKHRDINDAVETIALDDVSFKIKEAGFAAIMGPSGSGKSTIMHILGGLDLPTTGTYILDGENVEKLKDDELANIRNRKIGFVFQAFNLLPRTTALKNVTLPMVYAGIPKEERLKKAQKLNDEGHTIVMITHEPNIAQYAKRIIYIRDGKIVDDRINHKLKIRI